MTTKYKYHSETLAGDLANVIRFINTYRSDREVLSVTFDPRSVSVDVIYREASVPLPSENHPQLLSACRAAYYALQCSSVADRSEAIANALTELQPFIK